MGLRCSEEQGVTLRLHTMEEHLFIKKNVCLQLHVYSGLRGNGTTSGIQLSQSELSVCVCSHNVTGPRRLFTEHNLWWSSDSLHATRHEAGKYRHHHLRFDLHQVLRQSVHPGADLPGHGDSIPGETAPTVRRCEGRGNQDLSKTPQVKHGELHRDDLGRPSASGYIQAVR